MAASCISSQASHISSWYFSDLARCLLAVAIGVPAQRTFSRRGETDANNPFGHKPEDGEAAIESRFRVLCMFAVAARKYWAQYCFYGKCFPWARCETVLVPENQNHFSLDD